MTMTQTYIIWSQLLDQGVSVSYNFTDTRQVGSELYTCTLFIQCYVKIMKMTQSLLVVPWLR